MRYTFLLILWSVTNLLSAQDNGNSHLSRHHIVRSEMPGQKLLPVTHINTIFQDSEGYIWYGTHGGGLCRYDGYDMKIFRSDKSHPNLFESNDITCINEDTLKNIWIGTRSGVYVLDKKNHSIRMLTEKGVCHEKIKDIAVSTDGQIWVCAEANILQYSADGKYIKTHLSRQSGENASSSKPLLVPNLCADSQGNVWAMQRKGGLLRMNIHQQQKGFVHLPWTQASYPNCLIEDQLSRCYWIAAWDGGITKYCPGMTEEFTLQKNILSGGKLQSLTIDPQQNVLWAVATDGLHAYDIQDGILNDIDLSHILPTGIQSFGNAFLDKDGCLWTATRSSQPFILSFGTPICERHEIKTEPYLSRKKTMVELIAYEGEYCWIYHDKTRLSLYNTRSGKITFVTDKAHPSPITTQRAIEPCRKEGGIWTCHGHQLLKMRHEGMDVFWSEPEGVKLDSYITALHDNGRGQLIIGTNKAVYRYDYNRKHLKLLAKSHGTVTSIDMSKDETVYFATENNLPRMIQPEGKVSEIGKDKNTTALCLSQNGLIWMATITGNVYVYDPSTAITREDTIAGNTNGDAIKQLACDTQGHLWILSDRYLKEYNPTTTAFRKIHNTNQAVNISTFQTLNILEENICAGGTDAFCMFTHSKRLDKEKGAARPVVTSLSVNKQQRFSYFSGDTLLLTPDTTTVVLQLSTFDFLHSADIRFAYRLSKDKTWTYLPEGNNTISINHFSPGKYTLEVKATDCDGTWGIPQTAIHIICEENKNLHPAIQIFILLFILTTTGTILIIRKHRKKLAFTTKNTTPQNTDNKIILGEADRLFLEKATDIVNRNIANMEYSVELFSSDMCMSRMNLYRKIQSLTNQPPTLFIRDIRLKKAAQLLTTTSCPVNEISDMVGFSSPRYFSRCFKEMYGVLPSQYRKKHSNTSDTAINN